MIALPVAILINPSMPVPIHRSGARASGTFPPDSPVASTAGIEALTEPRDLGRARREIEAAGYKGERVVLLASGDSAEGLRRANVLADMMKKVGLAVDFQMSDRGTTMQRVNKNDPVDQGGWSCTAVSLVATDLMDPVVNSYLAQTQH